MFPGLAMPRVELVFRVLLLILVVCVFVPFDPAMPGIGLDASWVLGMNQAVSQGMRIGTDVVFTFGPYASIYTRAYHPATDFMMLAGSLFLAVSCWLSLSLIAAGRVKVLVALGLALWVSVYSRDTALLFMPFLAALVAYRVSEERAARHEGALKSFGVLIFAFSSIGLIPIIKGSMLILSLAVAFACALLFLLRKEKALSLLSLVVPLVSMLVFWVASGQHLGDLPNYFVNMLPIASGYTEAMAIPGKGREVIFYMIAAALLIASIVDFKKSPFSLVDLFLPGVYFLFLFISFKAGFVRHDGHALSAAFALLLAGLTLLTFRKNNLTIIALVCSIITSGIMFNRYVGINLPIVTNTVRVTFDSAITGIERRLTDSAWFRNDFESHMANYKGIASLPLLPGRSDIYSYNQTQLIASGNTWAPRPTFQGYSVYTPGLAEKNNQYLLGNNAPDNIFFRVEPIDGRLPSMDDGASWPTLLTFYRPVDLLPDYLLLKKRDAGHPDIKIQPGAVVTHKMDEVVELPRTQKALVAKIDIKPTVLGQLANILYKPAKLKITLTLNSGEVRIYRIISGMLKSGVIISPLIDNTSDFGLLYSGTGFLAGKVVKSIAISQEFSSSSSWKKQYTLQLSELELPEDVDNSKVYKFDSADLTALAMPFVKAQKCDGSIDALNDAAVQPSINVNRLLTASGWLAASEAEGTTPEAVYILLTDKSGARTFVKAKAISRIDVANWFKKPSLEGAGYSVYFDSKDLHGDYVLQLAMKRAGRIEVCPEYSISAKINDQVMQ